MTGRRAAGPSILGILIALALTGTAGSSLAESPPPTPSAPAGASENRGAPSALVIWNRPIVVFRAPVNQISPAERAAAAVRRFDALPDDVRGDEVQALPAAVGALQGVMVIAREHVLFGILDTDADPTTGETLAEVSQRAVSQLRTVIDARAEQRRLKVILRGIGLSLGAAAGLLLVLWAIWRAADRALLRVAKATHRRAVSVFGMDVRRPVEALERGLVRVTASGLGLVAAYVWLTFSLQQFPYTRPWAEELRAELFGHLRDLGTGALRAIPGFFAVVVIFIAARFVTRILDVFFQAVERDVVKLSALQPDTARASRQIANVLVWIFALTIAYQYLPGSKTDAFKAIGVLLGLMISLGSAGLVNQFMSGLVVVYSRALRPGEFVRIGDLAGRVSEVRLLSTKLVSLGEEMTIPNAVLVGTTVTNYSRLGGAEGPVVSTTVTIGYDAPWRQIHAMLQLAAERTPGLRRHPPPSVLQRALSDFSVEYELRARLETSAERAQVLSDLHKQIQDVFNEFGVQIMSPAFEAQPDRPVVVPKSRWFAAPAVPPADGEPAKEAPS
jgi:small-conductance mechanosensitive channel